MINIINWKNIWGNKRMYASLYNQRPAYTNNEIVNLFNSKIKMENLSEDLLAEKYNTTINTIHQMRNKKCRYSYQMLKIASNFLNIPYKELTAILIDDGNFSLRADTENDTEEFFGFVNYLFNEIIKQERLSK